MNDRQLFDDRRGGIDLIWRLIIMVILLASVIPAGIIGFREVNRTQIESDLRSQIEELLYRAESISQEGNLSKTRMELDVRGNALAHIEYVEIGDVLGGLDTVIRYRCNWKTRSSVLSSEEGRLRLTSPNNETLFLKDHLYSLEMVHIIKGGSEFVIVSTTDAPIDYSRF